MEGPPVKALSIKLSSFVNEIINDAKGNAKINYDEIKNKKIDNIFSIGKNLFFKINNKYLKIHFLMYGSIRINSFKEMKERLSLITNNGFINFYNCSVKIINEKEFKENFDEELDIVSEKWNFEKVLNLIQKYKNQYICDVLLYQEVFAGVGNIIKNEALFLAKVHPLSIVEKIPENVLRNIILQTRNFSLKFLETRLNNESLKKYLNVYRIKNCKYCNNNIKIKKLGLLNRISFYCEKCQILYS